MCGNERFLDTNNVVDSTIGVEDRLDIAEDDNGAVCAATAKFTLASQRGRETDSIVEGETERLVCVLSALATFEQVLLEIIHEREESTASCVCRSVLAVRASNTPGQGSYEGALC